MSPAKERRASQQRYETCAVLNSDDQNQKWPEGTEVFKYLCHITNYLCVAPHISVQVTNFLRVYHRQKSLGLLHKLSVASANTVGILKQRQTHKKNPPKQPKAKPKHEILPQNNSVYNMHDCTELRSRNKGYVCTICYHVDLPDFFSEEGLGNRNNVATFAHLSRLRRLNDTAPKPRPAAIPTVPSLLVPAAACRESGPGWG